jgi:outer membrane protein assembly factor BamB
MKAKIISGIMLTLLLVSILDFAAVNLAANVATSGGSSIDRWSMFRYDGSHTGYSNGSAPTENVTKVVWEKPTGGPVYSSPAVANDTVFIGSNDGKLYAFYLNGTMKYYLDVSLGYPIYSSPAVDSNLNLLFIGTAIGSTGHVYAINLSAINLTSARANNYAVDLTDANKMWDFHTSAPVYSSPTVAYGNVTVGSDGGVLLSINEMTGKVTTYYSPNLSRIRSSPAIADGKIFSVADNGIVIALNATTMSEDIWVKKDLSVIRFNVNEDYSIDTQLRSSPSVADDRVFVGSLSGILYALNETDGSSLWNSSNIGNIGAILSSPAVDDGMVFVGSNDTNKLYALDASNGTEIWNFTTGGAVDSSPAVANSTVFVGSMDGHVYAIDEHTGMPRWNCTIGGGVWSSPAIAERKVFVGSLDRNVYALEEPPTAIITHSPINPIVCQTVAFYASNSYDRVGNITLGNITTWSWNFGDGQLSDFENHTLRYAVAGTYNVTLTVTDDRSANDSTWELITVLEAWPMFGHDPEHWGNSTSHAPVNGTILWSRTISSAISSIAIINSTSSAAVINSKVFIGTTDGTFYALDANEGTILWSNATARSPLDSPAVSDNMVIIGAENHMIYAWDVNGSSIWSNHTNNPIHSSPTVSGNMVLIGSGSAVYAFNKTNGYKLWQTRYGTITGEVDSSPAVIGQDSNGTVFVGDWDGVVYEINETDGNVVNSKLAGYGGNSILGSPTIAYGEVFVGAKNGSIYAYNMDLKDQWNNSAGGEIESSPAVADGMVFVGSSNGLYAFNARTGTLIWKNTDCSIGYSSPAVADGRVYVGTNDNKTLALREADGALVWSYNTGGIVDSSPAILNDTLYIGSNDGKIYAFYGQVGGVHEVGISGVYSSTPGSTQPWNNTNYRSVVGQGQNATIYVNVTNTGHYGENPTVLLQYWPNSTSNNTITTTNVNLPGRTSLYNLTSINFNTTIAGLSYGVYNITAYVEPVPGQKTMTNIVGTCNITVSIPGDINGDGNVTLTDLVLLAKAYGTKAGIDPPGKDFHQWNPNADINDNGGVDLFDLVTLAQHYEKPT